MKGLWHYVYRGLTVSEKKNIYYKDHGLMICKKKTKKHTEWTKRKAKR